MMTNLVHDIEAIASPSVGRAIVRKAFLLSFMLLIAAVAGCGSNEVADDSIKHELTFDPAPPKVGMASVELRLLNKEGVPVESAAVKLEGNMNHAGMKPSFATLKEESPGVYVGELEWTMGGDWFVIISADLDDGSEWSTKVDVKGVQS